ncbi:MAG: carboxypeptidase regulatory-like domain-containing protein [Terriglobia bacterium]
MLGFKATRVRLFLAVPCLVMLLSPMLWAQLYTGTVTGVVSDPSGAVVPGAQVQMVDEQKGFTSTATTDTAGSYLFRSVPPGSYRVNVQAPGFKSETRGGIILEVNHNVTVNFALQVGAATQSVEVTAQAPVLDAQDAVTGQVIDRKYINDLPLVGRSLSDLAFLTPGVVEVDNTCPTDNQSPGANISGCPPNNFISNGSRMATSNFVIDGTSTAYPTHAIIWPTYEPAVDSVEEFAVQESNFSAEFGFTGSTVTNIVTRSGSNQFHGSGYDFLRNRVLDANNFFNNEGGVPLPALRLNDFGATVGGPIQKNKTFFFFDYNGIRKQTLSTWNSGLPDAAEKVGNFGELCTAGYFAGGTFGPNGMCSNPAGQLWDPYTSVYNANAGGPVRSGFIPFNNMATYQSPGNPNLNGTGYQIAATPGNLMDPVALKYMGFMPLPNLNVGTSAYNPYTNWVGSPAFVTSINSFDVKVDHRFTENDLLSVKYSQSKNLIPPFPCYSASDPADPCTTGTNVATAHLVAINYNHSFGPALLLTATLGITRGFFQNGSVGNEPQFKGLSPSATAGMPAYMDRSGISWMPAVSFDDYSVPGNIFGSAVGQVGTEPWCCEREGNDINDLRTALAWVKGNHSMKFGFDGLMYRLNYILPSYPAGYFTFNPSSTSEFPTSGGGDDIASFLTGVGGPGSYGNYDVPFASATQAFQYAQFIQDNWKVSKKLTLNLGFRNEINVPQTERHNRMNELDLNAASPLQVPSLGTLHAGEIYMTPSNRSNYLANYHNGGPRLGFAYSPTNNLVIRGGYGIYYSIGNNETSNAGAPGSQGFDQITPWLTTYQNDGATPWGRFSDPWPIVGPNLPVGSSLGLLNNVGFGLSSPIPREDSTTPYAQNWSFGIQRQLPSGILVDVSYLGNKGTHVLQNVYNWDHLGPQVEQYTSEQIATLKTYVPNPFDGIITNPTSSLSSSQVPAYQLQLPYPQFTSVNGDNAPWDNTSYNALQVKLEKRFAHGLQFLVTYTWSKSIDEGSLLGGAGELGSFTSLQDPNNYKLERGLSTFDIPQVFQLAYTYELPIGRGKAFAGKANSVVNGIIGGWQTTGIWRFNEGRPLALGLAQGLSLPTYGGQRPDLVGRLACASGSWNDRLNNYFSNPQVVVTPPSYAIGTAPRTDGSCRQPGQDNANLSIFKEFPLSKFREGARIEFRLETYNAFNHPQFAGPNTTLNSGSFGVITSQANQPRQAQAVLKVYW